MSNKNEVFEYLIGQLRQQVNNNQCEDLAQEVQSLKNQLRDASALVAELQKELDIANSTVVRLRKEIAKSTGDIGEYIDATEQSGCRKEDVQGCEHEWCAKTLYGTRISPTYCRKCGKMT